MQLSLSEQHPGQMVVYGILFFIHIFIPNSKAVIISLGFLKDAILRTFSGSCFYFWCPLEVYMLQSSKNTLCICILSTAAAPIVSNTLF